MYSILLMIRSVTDLCAGELLCSAKWHSNADLVVKQLTLNII